MSRPEEDLDVRGQAHSLVGCEQGPRGKVRAGARAGAAVSAGQQVRRAAGGAACLISHGGVAEALGQPFGGVQVGGCCDLDEAGVGEKGAGVLAIGGAELGEVLENGPELEAQAGHQPGGLQRRLQPAEGGELVQEQQHGRGAGPLRRTGQLCDALGHQQAEPARVRSHPVRRQHQEHGCGAGA